MSTNQVDSSAVRTALWRALHIQADDTPHIIEDTVGLELIQPETGWQERPDMKYTKRLRASIVAHTRFIEDLAQEQIKQGVNQYILLGAGLDTFAQRNRELCQGVDIYEIDQTGTLTWKEEKLKANGYAIHKNLHFVPVDFETESWWDKLIEKGFNTEGKTVLSCTGVTLYLSKEAIRDTLKQMSLLTPGSTLAIAFYLPLEKIDDEDKPLMEMSIKGALASGTPFVSFYSEDEIVQVAKDIGFKNIHTVSTQEMTDRYFRNRHDDLIPASGEFFLVAEV